MKRFIAVFLFLCACLMLHPAENKFILSEDNLEGNIPLPDKAKKVWTGTRPSHYLDIRSNTFLRIFYKANVAVVGKKLSRISMQHFGIWENLVKRHLSSAYNITQLSERTLDNTANMSSGDVKIYDYSFLKKPGVFIERLKQYYILLIFAKKHTYIYYISFLTQNDQIFAKQILSDLNKGIRFSSSISSGDR